MELQERYAELEALDTIVVAVSQEDTELAKAGAFVRSGFGDAGPRFPVVADLERARTAAWDRVTTYLIDRAGVVRQVFPTLIHARPSWGAVVAEVEALEAARGAGEAR